MTELAYNIVGLVFWGIVSAIVISEIVNTLENK